MIYLFYYYFKNRIKLIIIYSIILILRQLQITPTCFTGTKVSMEGSGGENVNIHNRSHHFTFTRDIHFIYSYRWIGAIKVSVGKFKNGLPVFTYYYYMT